MFPLEVLPMPISLLVLATVFWVLARMGAAGTLKRNGFFGIRTSATMQSDVAWKAGHRAAAPGIRIGALVQLFGAVLVVVLAFTTQDADVAVITGLVVMMMSVLGLLLVSTTTATTAANEAHNAWKQDHPDDQE